MEAPSVYDFPAEMMKSQSKEGSRRSFEQVCAPYIPSLCCPSIYPEFGFTDFASTTSLSPTPLGLSSLSSTSSHGSLPTSLNKKLQTQPCTHHAGHGVLQTHEESLSQCEVIGHKVRSVSLQQHLQHSDVPQREEALHSFMLERFLPAAQAVAADHDHGTYNASKSHGAIPPSSSTSKFPHNGPSLFFFSQRASRPKGVTWAPTTYFEETDTESLDNDPSSKACGFFRVGVKTALSRMCKMVHSSADSVSRRVAFSCVQRTRSSEEGGPYQPAFTSGIPIIPAAQDSWRFMKSPKNSFLRDGNINVQGGSPLQNRPTCYSSDSEHESDSSFEVTNSMGLHHAYRIDKYAPVIEEDGTDGALGMERSSLHHKDCETRWVAEDGTVDDEPEYYDALSRFDSISCSESIAPYSAQSSPKGPDFETFFKMDSLHPCSNHEEPFVFHANHATYSSTLPANVMFPCLNHKLGKISVMETGGKEQEGMDCLQSSHEPLAVEDMQAGNGHDHVHAMQRTLEASPILLEKAKSRCTTYMGFESPHKLGWPLGISGLQSTVKKPLLIYKSDNSSTTHKLDSYNVAAPPVPPAPSSSWLGKALALNASKPSAMLVSLQQKEKGKSASKELQFTPLDAAKDVRWEDVVKESQMHQEHLRFLEDPWNHNPSNHKTVRPRRL